jgi:hypothetical protein
MIAACAGERIWYTKHRGSKLLPNLYTFMLGPSGLGKDTAVNDSMKFLKHIPTIKLYAGKATAAHVIDYLSNSNKNGPAKIYLVTPEMAMSVGSGSLADDFVKLMTALYTSSNYPITEGTRTSGTHVLTDPCINWTSGSTEEWMMRCLTRDAIEGGFFARVLPIRANYDFANRIYKIIYPDDYEEVVDHIHARITILSRLAGEFAMTREADMIAEHWFMNRDIPEDDSLIPSWQRAESMILKVAMIFSLADNLELGDLIINKEHLIRAQRLIQEVHKNVPYFLTLAARGPETEYVERVASVIRRAKSIPRYILMRAMSGRMNAQRLDICVTQLLQERKVRQTKAATGAVVYEWIEFRKKFATDEDDAPTQ